MSDPVDFSRFGPELRRVRAGERAEDDGGKRVWHQAGSDVEILSHVDNEGHVLRQECHLRGTVVVWRAGAPVSTGALGTEARQVGVQPSETIVPDGEPSRMALIQALSLLRAAPAGDRYLDHFRAELEAAVAGLPDEVEDTVTTMSRRVDRPVVARPPPPRRGLAFGAAAVGAALAVGALAYWLLH